MAIVRNHWAFDWAPKKKTMFNEFSSSDHFHGERWLNQVEDDDDEEEDVFFKWFVEWTIRQMGPKMMALRQ